MELHVYREGSHDRIVKDETKEEILYSIKAPFKLFSTPPKEIYRGSEHLATITKEGYWHPEYSITLPSSTITLTLPTRICSSESTFTYNGREYMWKSDKKLSCNGKIVARFDRKYFALTKKGILKIDGEAVKMVDVIVVTAIAMQYRWEETRRRRHAVAASGATGGGS
jgi:hypothetical protein